jgi:hypothetical protein
MRVEAPSSIKTPRKVAAGAVVVAGPRKTMIWIRRYWATSRMAAMITITTNKLFGTIRCRPFDRKRITSRAASAGSYTVHDLRPPPHPSCG